MLHALNDLLAPAAMERLTLVVNHVVGGEPAATDRLRAHAGRTIAVLPQGWPSLLPPLPALAFRVTPAGLLEWCGLAGVEVPDLSLRVDVSNPARLAVQALSGETPQVQIEGDAQFAGDINWLLVNLPRPRPGLAPQWCLARAWVESGAGRRRRRGRAPATARSMTGPCRRPARP
jgi:ubiquinone biosynthesis accessory factor UbiJ